MRNIMGDSRPLARQVPPPCASRFTFQFDGVLFQASHTVGEGKIRLRIGAILGYMPYSAESAQRRRIVLRILEGSGSSKTTAKFGINADNQIVVRGEFLVDDIDPADFVFVPAVTFLRDAMPFIRLIGSCL